MNDKLRSLTDLIGRGVLDEGYPEQDESWLDDAGCGASLNPFEGSEVE